MERSKYYYIRYGARIFGAIACIFYLFISFKGGLGKVMRGTGDGLIPFFPFLAIAILGYMVAYVQEKKGGYFMLVGGVALFVFFLVYSRGEDWARAVAYGFPFILSALGFIYCNEKE